MLVLNALGNGLWDAALRPLLVRVSYGLMSLSSLGMESVRTGIYERIATGSTSTASINGLAFLTNFMFLLEFGAFLLLFSTIRDFRKEHAQFERRMAMKDGKADTSDPRENREKLLQRGRRLLKFAPWALYGVGIMLLLSTGVLLVDVSRVFYENAAIVHFQQALKITSPYLTDADRSMVESKFAQIHSKAEYVAIVDGLEKTAKGHGQQVPTFNAW